MAWVTDEKLVKVFLNPDELRKLADIMEREFPSKVLGDTCYVATIAVGKEVTVQLHADQEWFMDRRAQR